MGTVSVLAGFGNSASAPLLSMGNSNRGRIKQSSIVAVRPKETNKIMKSFAPPLVALLLSLSSLSIAPVSLGQTLTDIQKGAILFNRSCIGCHDAGGNIIQPGATLFIKDLQRNGIDTEEEIYKITYFGKGRMPGFGENCTPRGQCTFGPRLLDEEIKLLAKFVKLQADNEWPTYESVQE